MLRLHNSVYLNGYQWPLLAVAERPVAKTCGTVHKERPTPLPRSTLQLRLTDWLTDLP